MAHETSQNMREKSRTPDIRLHLSKPARPSAEGYRRGINHHPSFCHVCTNFDWAVAEELFMLRNDIFMKPGSRAVTVTVLAQEVDEAAAGGCSSCILLRACALALSNGRLDMGSEQELTITYRATNTIIVHLSEAGDSNTILCSLELFTLPGEPCPWPTIGSETAFLGSSSYEQSMWPGGTAKSLPIEASSEECFDTIKQWIAECELDHPYCSIQYPLPNRDPALYARRPKRLVRVGTTEKEIRLFEVPHTMAPAYIALSYCWGQTRRLVATRDNYAQLQSNIPWDPLPRTIQDAIVITRNLRIEYLWVDGLCIIQGDREDWEEEAENMASIYANAHLTIAATASPSFDEGCFRDRDQTIKIQVTEVSGVSSNIFARRALGHSAFDWADEKALNPKNRNTFVGSDHLGAQYPLFGRGWCFQERLLSPRIVHYTGQEIVWECLGMTSCECGTMDRFVGSTILRERRSAAAVPPDIEVRCGKLQRSRDLAEKFGLLDVPEDSAVLLTIFKHDYALMLAIDGIPPKLETEDVEMRERWRRIVSQYSSRTLTYDTDALPALSGLSKSWQAKSPGLGRYLAGLWEYDLLRGLLWQCIDRQEAGRPIDYLAPSWSWASIKRAVSWLPFSHDPIYHVSIINVVCQPSGLNTYGEVASGYVKLRGPVLVATLKAHDIGSLSDGNYEPGLMYLGYQEMTLGRWFSGDSEEECRALVGQEVYCLWCSTDVNDLRTMIGFERALILQRCSSDGDTFRRLGVVENFPLGEWQATDALEEMELTII